MSQPGDRAASEVIGAVILFGFIVIAFTIYQGVVVPQQNKAVEFNHNEAVQDAIQDLRNAVRQTATTGAEESVSIKLGATYPERVLAINPGASAGSIQTESLGAVSIQNVSGTDNEVQDYFGSVTTTLGPFESKVIVYRPIYFQYSNAPNTLYENTLAYNHFPDAANLTITDQAVIDGRKITLIALTGNVSEARQGTVSIDTQSVSTATSSVSIEESGGPINITFTTRMTAEEWNETLADQLDPVGPPDDPQKFVTDVRQTGPNQVSIILEQGEQYELKLAKVGVGADTPSVGPKYIVDVEGDETSVIENGTQKLVVEVRDRFNNAVSNATVTAGTPSNGSISPGSTKTDARGRAVFIYEAPSDVNGAEDETVELSFNGDGTDNESVMFNIRVLDADGSGGGDDGGVSEVNPSGTNTLILEESVGNPNEEATLTFNNTADSSVDAIEIRVPFYFKDVGGHDSAEVVESFGSADTFEGAENFSVGSPLTTIDNPVEFTQGTTDVTIVFGTGDIRTRGDFFILVLKLDDGSTFTYFVAPQ